MRTNKLILILLSLGVISCSPNSTEEPLTSDEKALVIDAENNQKNAEIELARLAELDKLAQIKIEKTLVQEAQDEEKKQEDALILAEKLANEEAEKNLLEAAKQKQLNEQLK